MEDNTSSMTSFMPAGLLGFAICSIIVIMKDVTRQPLSTDAHEMQNPESDCILELGILEQSPRLRTIYTQLCFCYSRDASIEHTAIIEKLEDGLEKLAAKFPWVAGQVVCEGAHDGSSGIFKIKSFKRLPILRKKDLTEDENMVSMEVLKASDFPIQMLDERMLCPRTTLSEGPNETSSDPFPVFLLQVNFIEGGLLLAVQACHSAMDIVGQIQIIQLLSKACNGEEFTAQEIQDGNLDRRNSIPLLDHTDYAEEVHQEPNTPVDREPREMSSAFMLEDPLYQWGYFIFEGANLPRLKAMVESSLPLDCKFISTDDAICAILWQSIGRARSLRLPAITDSSFVRQVDMRQYMNISQAFTGNLVVSTTCKMTLQDLGQSSLGTLAAQLRSKLDPGLLRHTLQHNAAEMARRSKNRSGESSKDRSRLIVMSSWTKAACHNVDFGLGLGKPDSIRRPQFSPVEGVIYLLPKGQNGEIAACLCLRDEDMQKMETDLDLLEFTRYVG